MFDNSNPHSISAGREKPLESPTHSYQSGYQPPIVLVKKVPPMVTDEDLTRLLSAHGEVKGVSILQPKFYAYVEFSVLSPDQTLAQAMKCVDHYSKQPLMLCGQPAEVYLTSAGKNDQKPLDLNPPSAILLLTFFKIKSKVTVPMLLGILRDIEAPRKIVIYEKQNLHALVEMTSAGGARHVKEALDGKMWKGLFLIRVQFTSKKSLSVNPNSPMEYEAPEREEEEEGGEEEAEEMQYWAGQNGYPPYPPYNNMYPPMPVPHLPPVQSQMYPSYQYQTYTVAPQPPYHHHTHAHPSPHPPSPPMKPQANRSAQISTQHSNHPPSPVQHQTRGAAIGALPGGQTPPLLPKAPAQRFTPVQMQPLVRSQQEPSDPKEVYYYNKNHHQYAPPQYPQMFNSPQIAPYRQQPPVKFSHNQADERYLLQYCSPMVRPHPIHRPQRPLTVRRIVQIEGLKDNARYEPVVNLCSQFGSVVSLKVIKKDGVSLSFVQFASQAEAQAAAEHLDGLNLQGSHLEVELSKYSNLQEIDIFEKGKTSLFMDFSAELESTVLDSPSGGVRRAASPSPTLELLGPTQTHRKELESLIGEGVKSLRWTGSLYVAEMAGVEQAFNLIARLHQTSLSDGSKVTVRFVRQSKPDWVGRSGSEVDAPECISEHNSDCEPGDSKQPSHPSKTHSPLALPRQLPQP